MLGTTQDGVNKCIKGLVPPNVINYSCRSKHTRPLFIFGTEIKLFSMITVITLRGKRAHASGGGLSGIVE